MPQLIRLARWMRAKLLTITTRTPRCSGAVTAASREGAVAVPPPAPRVARPRRPRARHEIRVRILERELGDSRHVGAEDGGRRTRRRNVVGRHLVAELDEHGSAQCRVDGTAA